MGLSHETDGGKKVFEKNPSWGTLIRDPRVIVFFIFFFFIEYLHFSEIIC